MKDFNTFTSEKETQGETLDFSNPMQVFANLAEKYEGKSADEIMLAIIKQAEISRKKGTLTDADIDNFASSVAPLLNGVQRKTLQSVIDRLKNIK